MSKTVAAFNAMTGHSLTEEQGWKFMVCLKLVRSEHDARGVESPTGNRKRQTDNFVDGAAYFGLAGEAAENTSNISDQFHTLRGKK